MSILLLTSRQISGLTIPVNPNYRHLFPANRVRTYQEMLLAGGLRCDSQEIEALSADQLTSYQTIIVCAPFKCFSRELFNALISASKVEGLSVISDSWLLDKRATALFGVKSWRGFGFSGSIRDRHTKLLAALYAYPHSEEGFAIGVRPLLRLLLQNWIVKRIVLNDTAQSEAYFSSRKPAIVTERFGIANNILLNFYPSLVFKNGGLIHDLFRRLLMQASTGIIAGFDLSKTACLRMDDLGSCERVHLEGFNCGVIDPNTWQQVRSILTREQAMLNIAYVPVWVDDGDQDRGTLTYQDEIVAKRIPGQMFASWKINYNQAGRENSHHYADEYLEIKQGVDDGVCYILSHGLTHISTHVEAWVKADDRYSNMKWYREFREMVTNQPVSDIHLIKRLQESCTLLTEAFGCKPTILVQSAHEQTLEIPDISARAGYSVCSSRATFILQPEISINRKIKAFYPSETATARQFSEAGFPVIYTFHDYDIYQHGSLWLEQQIDMLKSWGIERFVALEYLCALLMSEWNIEQQSQQVSLTIRFPGQIQGADQLPIFVNHPIQDEQMINGQATSIKPARKGGIDVLAVPVNLIDSNHCLVINLVLE